MAEIICNLPTEARSAACDLYLIIKRAEPEDFPLNPLPLSLRHHGIYSISRFPIGPSYSQLHFAGYSLSHVSTKYVLLFKNS